MSARNEKINFISIFDRDTILHLRLPFSFFLLPVFTFGISQSFNIHTTTLLVVFIALHFFIYPGSNVYNSYMDKDTGSIGGLRNPPAATVKLYYASIVIDITGLLLCSIAGWKYSLLLLVYIIFSKAYSWHGIRIKSHAYTGWAVVAILQGGFTYMLANMAAEDNVSWQWFTAKNVECIHIATLLIGAYYPLTQIYQHEEDSKRGDYTISYRLGIKGTFLFSAFLFLLATLIFYHYFTTYYGVYQFFVFAGCLAPVTVYFLYWAVKATKDIRYADFNHAMLMTKISSVCMLVCFVILTLMNYGLI